MEITTAMVKELREATGAGILECKRALEEALGDPKRAAELLRQRGIAKAAKKADRSTEQGRIEAYVHSGNRLASLVELKCETDFVARTEEFKELAHHIAMQVAAARPQYLSPEDIPPEALEGKRSLYRQQALESGKPEQVVEKIVEGKLKDYFQEVCLLWQPFIKDEGKSVQEVITEYIAKLGENIRVGRFARIELSEE